MSPFVFGCRTVTPLASHDTCAGRRREYTCLENLQIHAFLFVTAMLYRIDVIIIVSILISIVAILNIPLVSLACNKRVLAFVHLDITSSQKIV